MQGFFNGLSLQHLHTLADCAMEIQFPQGALIFREGDLANRFYLLLSGEVVLEASIEKDETVPLQILGPGELLGWSWLFSQYIWHLHARAIEPSRAIFFYGTRLRELCENDHDLGYEMFKRISQVMMQRLQSTRRLLLEGHKAAVCRASDWEPGAR